MAYSPEPTHPLQVDKETGHDLPHTAQLQREFNAIEAAFFQLTDIVRGALPWKAFNVLLQGVGGAAGGGPNPTLPTIGDSYNIDLTYGTNGIIRVSEGVYQFKLLIPIIGGVNVLEVVYPNLAITVDDANTDIEAESVRTLLTGSNPVTGEFQITVQQLVVPPSGKGSWDPYDLRADDRLWATGTLNVSGQAKAYRGIP